MVSLTVPDNYGYVILGNIVVPFFTNFFLGGMVMKARKEYDVQYPNLYATPGFHKQADAFNRVQRGHQAMFEGLVGVTAMGMCGGLQHPIVSALSGVFFCAGSYFYLVGYADTKLDVATARYQKGGILKVIGMFAGLGTCISTAGTMNGWW